MVETDIEKALIGGPDDDYGPCSCGEWRATIPVAIPKSWVGGKDEVKVTGLLKKENFRFAMGYDFRRVFGVVDRGKHYLNFSCCSACMQRAIALGIAEEVEDVGFSSNVLVENILKEVGNNLQDGAGLQEGSNLQEKR